MPAQRIRVAIAVSVGLLLLPAWLTLGSVSASATPGVASFPHGDAESFPVGPIQALTDISCPTTMTCTAIGIVDAKDNAAFFGTSNGGGTWVAQSVSSGTPFAYTISCPTVAFCLAMGIDANDRPNPPIFVHTTDGGSHWTTNPPSTSLDGSIIYHVTCTGPTSCYVIEGNHVYRSTDLGVTWTLMVRQPGWQWIELIDCVRASVCLVVGTDPTGSLQFGRIEPNGASVSRVATLPHVKGFTPGDLSCSSALSCAVMSWRSPRMLMSSNGGVNWTVRSLPAFTTVAGPLSCPDPKVCVIPVASSHHMGVTLAATTRNDGATWTLSGVASAHTSQSNIGVSGISCPSASVCFVTSPAQHQDSVFVRTGFTSKWVQELVK